VQYSICNVLCFVARWNDPVLALLSHKEEKEYRQRELWKPAISLPLLCPPLQVPLWWCIVCPLVLGMLAPFIFNFGLTAVSCLPA
jgi:hypothetical protein